VCAAISRTENWREPPLTSLACAGSHVGLCAVDIEREVGRLKKVDELVNLRLKTQVVASWNGEYFPTT